VSTLLGEGARFPGGPSGVPEPNTFLVFGQDQTTVVTQSWYLDAATGRNDPSLLQFARDRLFTPQ